MNTFEQYVSSLEEALLSFVEHGSDSELFLSSYLQGHVDVIIAEHFLKSHSDTSSVFEQVNQSLQSAFNDNELEGDDQQAVSKMWQKLHAAALSIG